MNEEINKLVDSWGDFLFLDEDEWSAFLYQLEEIQNGQTFEQVKKLADHIKDYK